MRRTLFVISAVLTGLLGTLWLAAPQLMLAAWGTSDPDAITVYMSRRYGGLFFGYTVLLWMARGVGASAATKAILAGGAVVTAVLSVVSLVGALSGVVGPIAWGVVLIEVALAVAFVYAYATD